AGAGWIVVQQRLSGVQHFYHNWATYRSGFGDVSAEGEFFIGLEKLHLLLARGQHELYVWMQHVDGTVRYAHYDNFSVGDEQSGYQLHTLGQYSGNSSDALRRNERMKFTTLDRDNDKHST
ncbi:hypothetical protein KR093_001398, partial [Drosophila rubida]